ncbi:MULTISPECIES: ATP-dependent DNA helicase DinG [unclassified Oceanobacter]|uniref:ATP-dependent DNA helicase DinG n=2 Tax=Gammaproteobacteria TaxID=1236 RepID=UPI0026E323BB|nr:MULTISPECIES: ATP-dependent DNA helicase DinG [unclassified Oceanobacter]MDO6681189.1 ATP-dependent DNA helicase DinG [Oceanobacter sp. 5_MG-2023]MDP2504239.1 ATP-dependent DNA helicase DinG [Oceanobacter sp. 3_MG-2023]MDP2546678.1 ATP-dependent DNA helicase DinG [Oceanobacter sp. 4_MG-2023]
MLSQESKERIQALYRECIKKLDLTPRYGQRVMIAEIAKSLGAITIDDKGERNNESGIVVVEAGTGTGKTLAYLLATLPVAIEQEKKLLISTATVALQEQILDKDLPNLKETISMPFQYALAKGRGRYLCLLKLDKSLQQLSGILSTVDLFEQTPEEQDRELYELMLSQYASGGWDGDRDRWDDEVADNQWSHLTATHRECSNRRCPHFDNCAFFKARGAMEDADIIVANHDLVLSDLSLGGGAVLPAPEKTIYVFDEGHHLADKALNHFRLEFGVRAQRQWLKQLEQGIEQFVAATGLPPSIMHSLQAAPEQCRELNNHLNLLWPLAFDLLGERDRQRFEFGRIPDNLRDLLNNIKAPLQPLLQGLDKLNDMLQASLDTKGEGEFSLDIAESWQAPMGMMLARAESLWEAVTWLAAEEKEGEIPVARWLSKTPFGEDWDIKLSASPIAVADQLRKNLWSRCHGAVVTSATLTALNSFGKLSWETGLPDWAGYHRVASPFDYPNLGQLEVVQLGSDPKSDQFQTDIEQWMKAQLDLGQGTLVLFSSRAQLEATRDTFIRDWYETLLCQGFLPKSEIVRRHKERLDKGEGSIIFGLASFAEGIDLPGHYVTHVVIVKIPFAVPDDPIQAATSEWLESRGRNPFMDLTLPAASIRLVQACGRLIRKETDSGRISILDRRLTTTRYGKLLLDSLPPLRRM